MFHRLNVLEKLRIFLHDSAKRKSDFLSHCAAWHVPKVLKLSIIYNHSAFLAGTLIAITRAAEGDYMKKLILASLLLPLVLMLPVFAKNDEATKMSEVKTLFSCMLNKSETLEVYENKVDGEYQLTLETRNFLETLGQGYMINLNKSKIQSLDFGNTVMFTYNIGRSGYLFLRIEKNSKPHPEDVGNITVFVDNSLFNERDHALYTGGKLVALSDCTWKN